MAAIMFRALPAPLIGAAADSVDAGATESAQVTVTRQHVVANLAFSVAGRLGAAGFATVVHRCNEGKDVFGL